MKKGILVLDCSGTLKKVKKDDVVNYFEEFYNKDENLIIFFKYNIVHYKKIIDRLNLIIDDEYTLIMFDDYDSNSIWFNDVFIEEKPLQEVLENCMEIIEGKETFVYDIDTLLEKNI
jgi:hypothetical protein